MKKKATMVAPKLKQTLRLDKEKLSEIKDYKVGNEYKVSAIGKITNVGRSYNGGYYCEFELSDIDSENITIQDKKDMEEMGIDDMKRYKKIQALKKKIAEKE